MNRKESCKLERTLVHQYKVLNFWTFSLVHFFNEVHPAIPLFRTGHFLKKYDDGLVEKNLLTAIVTIAAKALGPISF
jgi:hypothetical protein